MKSEIKRLQKLAGINESRECFECWDDAGSPLDGQRTEIPVAEDGEDVVDAEMMDFLAEDSFPRLEFEEAVLAAHKAGLDKEELHIIINQTI